ncbi:MAG: ABC transporter permease [Planctomycetota bacterium]|nr:ABC transporter permease [Planctomycetota bacterium]MDA0921405.1 ABC transporter permease [Planctomycetota bacterium]MDA1159756.1 ABC transporter permease [Planctomycetota bacterium]
MSTASASRPDTFEPAGSESPAESALLIRDLCKDYELGSETVRVLQGINLDVPVGDYVAIMGPSGSGKSTLLNLLGCLDRPTSGEYHLGGQNVATLSDDQLSAIRARSIGFVFQAYNLIQQLTVLENIEVPLAYQGGVSDEDRNRCRKLADEVGLGNRLGHRPNELSGGQQQRAGIARSLSNRPQFILADEATGNLDTATTNEILDLFDRLNNDGATIVMVTHEEEVAARARRIVRLRDGVIEKDEVLRPVTRPSEITARQAAPATNAHSQRRSRKRPSRVSTLLRDLRVGLKSLLLHPLRSLLTVLGIFIGVASVIWLLAIGQGIAGKAQEQIEELGANNIILTTSRPPSEQLRERKIYYYGLTDEDCRHLEATIPTIEMAIPFCRRTGQELGYLDRQARTEINACTPEYLELYSLEVSRGRFLDDHDNETSEMVCVLTQELANELFRHEDPLQKTVRIYRDFFRVVGVVAARTELESVEGASRSQDFSDNVYIPIETFWQRFGDAYSVGNNGGRGVSQITLRLKDQDDAIPTGEAVTEALRLTHQFEDYTVGVPLELLEQARNSRLMFMGMMGLIAGISLIVGGIGIMNIMLATVTERTREIGIRRALGARRRDITRQFVIETILLSVAGGITGILGGLTCGRMVDALRWGLTELAPEMMESMPESIKAVDPIVLPWSIPLAFGISVGVGVVFGLYPARRAAAMSPIDALRHVA